MVASVLLLGLAVPAAGQVRVSTVQEAFDRWTPETHLYVLGDVGLGVRIFQIVRLAAVRQRQITLVSTPFPPAKHSLG